VVDVARVQAQLTDVVARKLQVRSLTSVRVLCLVAALACTHCKTSERSMPAPANILSAFTRLDGGFSQAIAPGNTPLTLNAGAGAAWWDDGVPVTVALPPQTPVDGTRWLVDGKSLRVGLGTLDLAARAWHVDPVLEAWSRSGPDGSMPVNAVAWTTDTAHVALLSTTGAPDGSRTSVVIVVSAADGRERGRQAVEGASMLVASDNRVLVAGRRVALLDLDAKVIAEPAEMPASVVRVREGAGVFAAVGAGGAVALVRPADGAVLATWDGHAIDAVPIAHGIVSVDQEGNVWVGCLEKSTVRTVASSPSGVGGAVLQVVGQRLLLAGAGVNPVHVAMFTNPCSSKAP
jgi:hypothetical protein